MKRRFALPARQPPGRYRAGKGKDKLITGAGVDPNVFSGQVLTGFLSG